MIDAPKDLVENKLFRANILDKAETDVDLQKALKAKCKSNITFFFDTFLWTYDPRLENKELPFILYKFQEDYIRSTLELINNQKDSLTEKSRDMGASWMILGIIYYLWLFRDGFNALIGSYIEDLVDSKEMSSHFSRLDFFIKFTPKWLLPDGFSDEYRTYMYLKNPENGAEITGAAPTERFSRQGRYTLIWADEFAFWQHGRSAWNAMGDATKCRIVTSTVNGKGNKFADLALKSTIKKFTLHWKQHPLKTQKWYEEECSRRTPEEVAQELDISYNKAVTGRVYPEFCERNYLAKQEYNPLQPLYVSWDFGLKDETALIWFQLDKSTGIVRVIDAYQKSGKGIDYFVPFVTGQMLSIPGFTYDDREIAMIEKHKRWQPAIHYGDPTGDSTHQTSKTSVIQQLKKYGIHINVNWNKFSFTSRHAATTLLIRRLEVDKDLTEFIDAIENARYPERSESSQSTSPIVKPIHDWTSHYRTALEYFAVNEPTKPQQKREVTPKERTKVLKTMRNPSYRTAC